MKLLGTIAFMALRNLGRNPLRTISTLLGIVIGMVGLILLDGYVSYSMWGLRETIIHSGTGHVQLAVSDAYFDEGENDPFSFLLPDPAKLTKELRRMPQVKAVLPSLNFYAVVHIAGTMETVLVRSLPSGQTDDTLSFLTLREGEWLGDGHGRILVGEGLASRLRLKASDTVSLFAASQGGGTNSQDFAVAGVVSSGIAAADASTVFVDLADAQQLLMTDSVPQLTVWLEHTEDTDAFLAELKTHRPPHAPAGMVLRSWSELSPYYVQAHGSYEMVLGVARLIVLLVTLFSIYSTMTLSVLERLREVGTLRAFGTKRVHLTLMFVAEGLVLGLIGAIAGSVLGGAAAELLNAGGGVLMPAQPGMSRAISILFRPDPDSFFLNGGLACAVAVLGAFAPAVYSSRQNPSDLLRAT